MTKPVLGDKEILVEVKRFIPITMVNDRDFGLLQAYFRGHAAGIELERRTFLKVMQESLPLAMVKFIQKEIEK